MHQVGFVYRKWPAAAFAKGLVAAGEAGEVVHYRGWFFHDHGLDPALPLTWWLQKGGLGRGQRDRHRQPRHRPGPPPGGRNRWACSPARGPISAAVRLLTRPGETGAVDVDEVTDMLVEFAGGVTGTLQTSWLAGGHKMDVGFAVHGTEGSVEYTSERPMEVRLYRTSDPAPESGFRAIPLGPSHPGGELFWPVAGMAVGFGEGFRSWCGTCC